MSSVAYLTGQLLLALPGIDDPRFEQAVVLMCGHDEQGAMGIGVGHIFPDLRFHALLEQLEIAPGEAPDVPIMIGGPVDAHRGFILHSTDWSGEDSVYIGDRWVLTSTLDILRAIAEGRGPRQWIVALGYAGWGAGQLEGEMTRHGWFTTQASDALLFDVPVSERWGSAYRDAGIDVSLLSSSSGTA